MRVPFQISAKGMQYAYESRNEMTGVVEIIEVTGNHRINGLKETVQQGTIFEKEGTKPFVNGEDTMTVRDFNQLERHRCGAFCGVGDAACRAKPAVTSKGNKLGITALWTSINGPAKRRIPTVDHLINVEHFNISGMACVFDFLIMISEDLL